MMCSTTPTGKNRIIGLTPVSEKLRAPPLSGGRGAIIRPVVGARQSDAAVGTNKTIPQHYPTPRRAAACLHNLMPAVYPRQFEINTGEMYSYK